MLKSQDDYTTLIATFEGFILLVYMIIDDLYQPVIPMCVPQRQNVITTQISDPKIITLNICNELLDMNFKKAWYLFAKWNYQHLPLLSGQMSSLIGCRTAPSRRVNILTRREGFFVF